MATLQQKLWISAGSAFLFTLINLPQTYQCTDKLFPLDLYNQSTNCPTNIGLVIHAIIFFVLTFLSMGNFRKNTFVKLKNSIYGALIFFLISSPAVFTVVGSIFGKENNINGCPTIQGIILHAILYFVALVGVMYLPDRN